VSILYASLLLLYFTKYFFLFQDKFIFLRFLFAKTGRLEQTARFSYGSDEKYLRGVILTLNGTEHNPGLKVFHNKGGAVLE
jgi:hypothetical protein